MICAVYKYITITMITELVFFFFNSSLSFVLWAHVKPTTQLVSQCKSFIKLFSGRMQKLAAITRESLKKISTLEIN